MRQVKGSIPSFKSIISWLHCAAMACLVASVPFALCAQEATVESKAAADSGAVQTLRLGAPVERQIAGGESHTYRLHLEAGQYLHLVVEQKGIDVVVKLLAPNGGEVVEEDNPNGTKKPESLEWIADTSGTYFITVNPLSPNTTGNYLIRTNAFREATQEDRSHVATLQDFRAAERLRLKWTRESLHEALAKYEDTIVAWRDLGRKEWEVRSTISLGYVHLALGNNPKAEKLYDSILPQARAIKDSAALAEILNNLAAACANTGKVDTAITHYKEALALLQVQNDRYGVGYVLNNLGQLYGQLGEPLLAIDYLHQALQHRQAVKDTVGEAMTLNNLGTIHSKIGKIQNALHFYRRALPMYDAVHDLYGQSYVLNNIGHIYYRLGEDVLALNNYQEALDKISVVGDDYGRAMFLNNIGAVHRGKGELSKALEYYEQSLKLKLESNDNYGEAITRNNIGAVYDQIGDKQMSLQHHDRALDLRRQVKDVRGQAESLNNIGYIHFVNGDIAVARSQFSQAMPLAKKAGDRELEARVLRNMALMERQQGNIAAARDFIEKAVAIVDSMRVNISDPASRASYSAPLHGYHELHVDLLMEMHKDFSASDFAAAALAASERARARSLLESLNEIRIDLLAGVDSSVIKQELTLQFRINQKESARSRLLRREHEEELLLIVEKELQEMLIQYRELQAQIRAASPHYAAFTQPQPLDAEQIRRQVLDEETLLLEYALGKDRSYLFTLTADTLRAFTLPGRAAIDSLARQVYGLLTERNKTVPSETSHQRRARAARADSMFWRQAAALSRLILAPAAELLGNKRLLIVADGALQYVPFAALPDPRVPADGETSPVPLALANEAVSLPSASVLAVLREQFGDREPAPKLVAALADPVYSLNDARVGRTRSSARPANTTADSLHTVGTFENESALEIARRQTSGDSTRAGFGRLLFSRREANAIMELVPKGAGLKALDYAANRETATSPNLSQFRIVHFASHGLLNSRHPELSGLVLSLVDSLGKERDGFLRLHDIYNLDLNADLVVLSACETALGREIRGEGLISLVRGFMYAGAPRVIASLWQVNDESTAELMQRFYRKLLGKEKLRPAAALRAAQLEMRQSSRWQSPYYWAAFVLQGEWR